MRFDKYKCIAFVGGGGKTSLIYYLAGLFVNKGKRVIVTTTTHMRYDPRRPFAVCGDYEKIAECLELYGYVVVGEPCQTAVADEGVCEDRARKQVVPDESGRKIRKISGDASMDWTALGKLCDVILVEADGARIHPLKVPASCEPVIPDCAELVVAVMGVDALNAEISRVCHRPVDVAAFLGCDPMHQVTVEDAAKILCSTRGSRKDVGQREYLVVLNKADDVSRRKSGRQLQSLLEARGVESQMMTLQRKKIDVILLAAGNSRRFGRENKLLHPVGGQSMFGRTLEMARQLDCEGITVVTQPDYEEIAEMARQAGAKVLYNPHPEEGIASSIRLGIQGTPVQDGWLLSVCDQPYMTLETMENLINCYFSSGKGIAALSCGGRVVNPAIFSRKYESDLLSLTGDMGGKHIIRKHRGDTAVYEVMDSREVVDVDEP